MPADQVETILRDLYGVDPNAARAMAQDIAATYAGKLPMGDVGMSGGISRDSMYSAVRDASANPASVVLPQQYQEQLPAFAAGAQRPYQRQLDQSLMNARGAMQETTNMAINGGRTPSQAMQQAPSDQRAYQASSIASAGANGSASGVGPGAVGSLGRRMAQNMPHNFNRTGYSAPGLGYELGAGGAGGGAAGAVREGHTAPGGPDFNDKYVRYRNLMVQQDPQNGQANFDMKLEQRRQLLMQELQAIEGFRNGNSAAMAGASNAMRASDELRKQSNYLSSPLYGTSSREAYDRAVDSDKDGE